MHAQPLAGGPTPAERDGLGRDRGERPIDFGSWHEFVPFLDTVDNAEDNVGLHDRSSVKVEVGGKVKDA